MKLSRLAIIPIALAIMGLFGIGLAASQTPPSTPAATQSPLATTSPAATAPATQAASPTTAESATPARTATASRSATPGATGTASAGQGPSFTVHPIVTKLAPSVVRIQTEAANLGSVGGGQEVGVGTGVIIDNQGHIVTNNHVVTVGTNQPAKNIIVTINASKTVNATIVGRDPATDLAVIKIDPSGLNLQPAHFGDVNSVDVGDTVVAIGFAFALPGEPTVTTGVLSAKARSIQEQNTTISPALQTDASINPGNSGGPLVDVNGDVIGINTAGIANSQNIGFAISAQLVKPIAQELIQTGNITRGYMGIAATDITPTLAEAFSLPVTQGVGLISVQSGSPADQAGLQAQDIIVSIAGEDVSNVGDMLNVLRNHKPGETVNVTYFRGNQKQTAQLTLGQNPNG